VICLRNSEQSKTWFNLKIRCKSQFQLIIRYFQVFWSKSFSDFLQGLVQWLDRYPLSTKTSLSQRLSPILKRLKVTGFVVYPVSLAIRPSQKAKAVSHLKDNEQISARYLDFCLWKCPWKSLLWNPRPLSLIRCQKGQDEHGRLPNVSTQVKPENRSLVSSKR
jgi:hypothetical protein